MRLLTTPDFWFAILSGIVAFLYLLRGTRIIRLEVFARYLLFVICSLVALILYSKRISLEIIKPTGILIVLASALALIYDFYLDISEGIKQAVSSEERIYKSLPSYIAEVCDAIEFLARRKLGALIVIEQKENLIGQIDGGMSYDAEIKKEILTALFAKDSPVHDGAMIVSGGRIRRVKAILPLKTKLIMPLGTGTRHRSAVSITESTDAIVLVVSEERGEVSMAYRGNLMRLHSKREMLDSIYAAMKRKKLIRQRVSV